MRLRARSEKELKEAARDDAHVVKIKTAYVFSTRVARDAHVTRNLKPKSFVPRHVAISVLLCC